MSWQATAWVSSIEAGGASGKLLLYALANYADEHGRCYPGDERIMRDTELSERAVRDWKRKLVDAGLISIERRRKPGGDFDLDIIVLSMGEPRANSAGGTTGKSCRHHRQMVPPPPANGAAPPTPPYIAEPSKEPSEEPERKRAGARIEDRKKVERLFDRAWRVWPAGAAGSRPESFRVWLSLSADQRQAARDGVQRWVDAYKAAGREMYPAFSRYLAEKRWEELPPPGAKAEPVKAKAFGKAGMAMRFRRLISGPTFTAFRLTAFEERMIAEGGADRRALLRDKQAAQGFPDIVSTDDLRSVIVAPEIARLGDGFVQARRGDDRFAAWEQLHAERGWPWVPRWVEWVWLPPGEAEAAISEFEAAVRGQANDGGGRDAAE